MENTRDIPIVDFDNVTYKYDEDTSEAALRGITLSFARGSFNAVIGHNGSGKSTLARLCNGLSVPSTGKVLVDGLDTSDDNNEIPVRQKVGLVFQDPDNQIVATIVEEDVAFGPENLSVPREEIRRRVDEALKAVGMYDFRLREPHMLSGGQKQRVAIAGMIAMRPECLVLDEPTAMLDPQGRKEVLAAIHQLNKEGMTIILITHFMEEAAGADRIIVMNDGTIALDGTPAKVFSQTKLIRSLGLDVPPMTALAEDMRQNGFSFAPGIMTVGELADAFCKWRPLHGGN